MPLSPGSRFGHDDVTTLLGEGGMGQVWAMLTFGVSCAGRKLAAATGERLAR